MKRRARMEEKKGFSIKKRKFILKDWFINGILCNEKFLG